MSEPVAVPSPTTADARLRSVVSGTRTRIAARIAFVLMLTACAESSGVTAPSAVDLTSRANAATAMADIVDRMLPAFESAGPTGPTRDVRALAGALRGLKTTLERTDMPIGPALALAEQALGPVEMAAANSPGELAELSLVRRALERAAELR